MEKYTKAKSKITKELIKQTDFNKRDKVDELLEMENFILNGTQGYNSKRFFEDLKKKYPNEYAEMFPELDPEGYKRILDKEREERERKEREMAFWKQKEEEFINATKEDWIKAGGKA